MKVFIVIGCTYPPSICLLASSGEGNPLPWVQGHQPGPENRFQHQRSLQDGHDGVLTSARRSRNPFLILF